MRYLFHASDSRFTVQAFARGALAALGHNPTFAVRDFTGEIDFSPDAIARASVKLTIQADSLALVDAVSAKDRAEIESRMRQEVLAIAPYPAIAFESTEISVNKISEGWYRLAITGKLSLHGVTKTQRVDAQFRLMEAEARLSGDTKLLQSAYRIKPVSALAGMLQLQDELKVAFDLVAGRQSGLRQASDEVE
jgi:polyisoprenoid-binding protein YceI